MVVLDSNIIIYLSKRVIEIDDIIDEEGVYAVSVITYMEILGFPFKSNEEEKFIKELLQLFIIIYLDEQIVTKVIEIRKMYKLKLPDAIICASAIIKKATLHTNDIRLKIVEELNIKSL